MSFSDRTPGDLSPNPIAKALEMMAGKPYLDLTESNPTRCEFKYPQDLLSNLGQPGSLLYEPFPFGHPDARQAVADYLSGKGPKIDPTQVILTASTSEAYSYLFKLLTNPGNAFLFSKPGYPLLDHLAQLEGVELLPFPLKSQPGWPIDLEQIENLIEPNTRGLTIVSPHNPTGVLLSLSDRKALDGICQKNSLALVLDEVFADFIYLPQSPTTLQPQALTFRLGGLSKSVGLPQLKLSWMVMEGPQKLVAEAQERLELIADTYLSVNTPVQRVLKDLLSFAPNFQKQVLDRLKTNRTQAEKTLGSVPGLKVWPAQAGWYLLVELEDNPKSEEDMVIELLEERGVFVQPGGFYDFEGNFLVISLLPPEPVFQEGLDRIRGGFQTR